MQGTTRLIAAVTCGLVAFAATAATAMTTSAEQAPDHAARDSGHHSMGQHNADTANLHDELAQVRGVTARFHNLDAALEAGYQLGWVNGSGNRIITGCIAHPTAGAMGYHYFNEQLMDDLAVAPLQPEVLVYAPDPDGQLRLAAVEWVARGPSTNPPGLSEPPSVLGMQMHILNPAVGFYIMHAWVWQPNPAGMFADWNPEVTCP
jgi:hypothetical protein